mmetsp:Transcript_22551/g.36676  ORF Transcript_22551/g.36676 Transcript_22551/m.36676 type:complete len:249 (+) Transcript_22551:2919-3665(+)
MGHPTNVRLVDTHAKGDSRHNDQPVFLLEPSLGDTPVVGVHAAMVVNGQMPRFPQPLCQRFGFGPRAAIDDPGLPFACGGKAEDLRPRPVLGGKGQMDVRPVKAAQKRSWRHAIKEFLHNFGLCLGISRGRECGQRHIQRAAQLANPQVIGAKIMAPLADAMRLVNGDHADPDPAQHPHRRPRRKAFRCDIQKLQCALFERFPNGIRFLGRVARGQRARRDTRRLQGADLIAHQRNQRRDHNSNPIAH